MGPGGFPGLQNQCDLTTSGWVGSIPARSRHAILEPSVDMRTLALPALGVVLAVSALSAQAPPDTLRADTARAAAVAEPDVAAPRPVRDTLTGAPIAQKSAFLRSLLVTGQGPAALERGTASGF